MSKPLVFWFESPPHVELGAIRALADSWQGEVSVVVLGTLREERREIGWEPPESFENLAFHYESSIEEAVQAIDPHFSSQHIFNGFSGPVGEALRFVAPRVIAQDSVVITERPGIYGTRSEKLKRRLGLRAKNTFLRIRWQRSVRLVLALGEVGSNQFVSYGWPRSRVLPYMYCPEERCWEPSEPLHRWLEAHQAERPLKGLFVGRFDFSTKGLDTLLHALRRTPSGHIDFDFVGGYGRDSERSVEWISSQEGANFLGSWSTAELLSRLPSYDFVVVPSRFDGWNVTVNRALRAGVGVVCTPDAVSHELITRSGAGQVFATGDAAELGELMSRLDGTVTADWRACADLYRETISPATVGRYLADSLRYAQGSGCRPQRPWAS